MFRVNYENLLKIISFLKHFMIFDEVRKGFSTFFLGD